MRTEGKPESDLAAWKDLAVSKSARLLKRISTAGTESIKAKFMNLVKILGPGNEE